MRRGCPGSGRRPIGLIDGERLLDLLLDHEIGVRRNYVVIHEVDVDALAEPVPPATVAVAGQDLASA